MKKEVLFAWIKAMESGKYPFARGKLRSDKGYCPLGILCDISKQGEWVMSERDTEKVYYNYCGQVNYLPNEVADWAELKGKERGDMPAIIMAFFDQGVPPEGIINHLKMAYKLE